MLIPVLTSRMWLCFLRRIRLLAHWKGNLNPKCSLWSVSVCVYMCVFESWDIYLFLFFLARDPQVKQEDKSIGILTQHRETSRKSTGAAIPPSSSPLPSPPSPSPPSSLSLPPSLPPSLLCFFYEPTSTVSPPGITLQSTEESSNCIRQGKNDLCAALCWAGASLPCSIGSYSLCCFLSAVECQV